MLKWTITKEAFSQMIPNIWGQGQLFAYSALDGVSRASDDFCGHLLGDAVGICFHSPVKRELRLTGLSGREPHFDAVTSDFISLTLDGAFPHIILYAREHLIVGTCTETVRPQVFVDGPCFTYNRAGVEIHDTDDGCYSALGIGDDNFAFAYGHSEQEVLELVGDGLDMSLAALAVARKTLYDGLPEDEHALLRAKCLSVMKTQLYSPEENFTHIWSTPDRYPHHHLWLWDSVFHAIGFRNVNAALAEDLVLAVFDHQRPDGFIPHMADIGLVSEITQPPVIAWGALKVYEKSGNKEFLKTVYDRNFLFLSWFRASRRVDGRELYTWNLSEDPNCRCDESGMDNSPRFDGKGRLFAVDASCFMANELRAMAEIARILGDDAGAALCAGWYGAIAADVNACLWSEEDGFYFDRRVTEDELSKVWAVSSFLPVFAGIAPAERAARLAAQLKNPETFGTPLPIPSIAANDPAFGTDMWRGPVWINYNYMICEGLSAYGYKTLADGIREKTVSAVERLYRERGTIYEFYDSKNQSAPCALNRKGAPYEPYNPDIRYQAIRDYGWSTTLIFDWLNR